MSSPLTYQASISSFLSKTLTLIMILPLRPFFRQMGPSSLSRRCCTDLCKTTSRGSASKGQYATIRCRSRPMRRLTVRRCRTFKWSFASAWRFMLSWLWSAYATIWQSLTSQASKKCPNLSSFGCVANWWFSRSCLHWNLACIFVSWTIALGRATQTVITHSRTTESKNTFTLWEVLATQWPFTSLSAWP